MAPREAFPTRALSDWRDSSRGLHTAFDHPILRLKPERIVAPAGWAGHLPFAFWLIAVHRPRVFVELGAGAGTSYCGFCQAVRHLDLRGAGFAVDTWTGHDQGGSSGGDVYEDLSRYHDGRYASFSTLVRATFNDARGTFPDGSIDLLHLDGGHDYAAARRDVESWLPKLSSRGVLLLHDIAKRRGDAGAHQLWDELAARFPSFAFTHNQGLGVLAVGSDQSPEMRWLTARGRSTADADEVRRQMVAIAAASIEIGELKDSVRLLTQELADTRQARDLALHTVEERAGRLTEQLVRQRADANNTRSNYERRLRFVEDELARLTNSTSWRLTAPIRESRRSLGRAKHSAAVQVERLLRTAYQRLPITSQHRWAIKTFGFRVSGWLMRGTASYQRWQGTVAQASRMMATLEPLLDERDVPRLLTTIEFAEVSDPVVSIVIPFYGQLAYTARCLASVARHLPKMPIEIVLVDDASPDNNADVLSAIKGVRVIRNPSNAGFIESCNRGAREARGRYLIFLNNDTEVQTEWCDELVRTLTEVPDCGIAGAKLVYPDGRLQEAGGIVWRDGSAWNYGRMDDPRKPVYCYRRDVDYVSGAAMAVPRDLFFDVGGFDACYTPAYYEDVDLAFKVRERGRRVVLQPRSIVVHYEGISSGRDLSSGVKAHQVENGRTFHARWRARLAAHHEPGQQVERARERGPAFRVLFLDHCTPEPDKDAGSGAVLHLFRILQGLGGKITFIPEDNYLYLEPYTTDLQRMGVECLYAPFVTSVKEHLQDAADGYDLILMYRYTTAVRHLRSIRKYAKRAKVVLLDVDLHFLRERREAELRQDQAVGERAERVKQQELAVIRQVDYTMVHSTVERDVLAAECATCPVAVFGWVADAVGTTVPYESRRDLLFVGGFQHPPNVDAVLYFANEILPRIRETLPDIRLHVVGSNPPAAIRELESDAVIIEGFVPDLKPLFDSVRVAIAPLRFGAGVKGKVATAMAHGVPSVATRMAAEGMDLVPGRDIVVADSPEAFAKGVCEVYSSPALWNTVSTAGLAAVQREFSSSRASSVISGVLDELGVSVPQDNVHVVRISSRAEYDVHVAASAAELDRQRAVEARLVPAGRSLFTVTGLCVNCGTYTALRVAVDEGLNAAGQRVPNWREQQICAQCGLNSRTRVALHAVQSWLDVGADDSIYLMEQTTPLFRALSARYPRLVASEYLGDRVANGQSLGGIRNEDATCLTFEDGAFSAILSFEVFEHIADYRQAFRESARCLKPGGRLVFTAPFVVARDSTLVRARLDHDGAVVHIEPPEYHGDPLSPKGGILCFQHFGWDIVEALKAAGFQSTEALLVWSRQFGYLGDNQLLFVASKAR